MMRRIYSEKSTMRLLLSALTSSLLAVACSSESPSFPGSQSPVNVESDTRYDSGYTAGIDDGYPAIADSAYESLSWNPDVECPPALEPLFLTLPALSQIEGQLLTNQSCALNTATKVYGAQDDPSQGPVILYSIISYSNQFADLPGFSGTEVDEFLAQQRQGWSFFLESLREKISWAAVPDIYTDDQIARLPRELLWQDTMPAVLDNGIGVWAVTLWITPDVAAHVTVYDEKEPDPTAEEALQRLTPLVNALNFHVLR